MQEVQAYKPQHPIRVVTATSLFDGHDASINIMRRILQSTGAEIIHLGHNLSAEEIVNCAVQEDAQAIAVTSYQGGHIEFFKYMYDLLKERKREDIRIFGGGGGVILPEEIEDLHKYGIARIYSPDDGRSMGLQGMINDLLQKSDFPRGNSGEFSIDEIKNRNILSIARCISSVENYPEVCEKHAHLIQEAAAVNHVPVLGITGTGGAGKSSLVDEFVRRFLHHFPEKHIAIVCVDPSRRKSGGALLGDRIRMNSVNNPRVYLRSMATRQANLSLSRFVRSAVNILKAANFDLIILETSGIGQADTEIIDHSDMALYVMTPEYGAASQLEKIDMLDFADVIALNKFDKRGGMDALRDVKKQYQRNHKLFDRDPETMPVYGTIASQFNDPGVNQLFWAIVSILKEKTNFNAEINEHQKFETPEKIHIIPPQRVRYLSEISETVRNYNRWTEEQADIAQKLYSIHESVQLLKKNPVNESNVSTIENLEKLYDECSKHLEEVNKKIIETWQNKINSYKQEFYTFKVRDKEIKIKTHTESLSHMQIPKICLPKYKAWGDILKWNLKENVPGQFPFTAGVFPFKREGEDPTRMFAGEGGPERTNKRFHYVSKGMPAKRLSTAFDSVTLYGNDPAIRPDIYGKIGNSGRFHLLP
jgi:isobutyryl-CoA mutase